MPRSPMTTSDRELLISLREQMKTIFNNHNKVEKRVARVEIFLGGCVMLIAAYGIKLFMTGVGMPTP